MELKGYFEKCHLFWAVQSSIDLLPPHQPALYAFYDALNFQSGVLIDEIDKFVTVHGRSVALVQNQWPFQLSINFRGNPDRFRGQGRALAQDLNANDADEVRGELLFLSLLNEPLYIGKTENIRMRFRAHHDTGFLFKMKTEYTRPPQDFVLFAFFCQEARSRLLESILIQTINPPHCEQKS